MEHFSKPTLQSASHQQRHNKPIMKAISQQSREQIKHPKPQIHI